MPGRQSRGVVKLWSSSRDERCERSRMRPPRKAASMAKWRAMKNSDESFRLNRTQEVTMEGELVARECLSCGDREAVARRDSRYEPAKAAARLLPELLPV